MNTKLLLEIKERILQEPENFGMYHWYGENSLREICSTAHCIGGWGMTLSGIDRWWIMSDLNHVFQINDAQVADLFFLGRWPAQFRDAYHQASEAGNLRIAAKIAAQRIQHFIDTGE